MKKVSPLKYQILVFALVFMGICHHSIAQNQKPKSEFWQKVRFGGGFGLGFGNNTFNGTLSPSAIYQATDEFAVGAGLNINYSKFQNSKLLAYGPNIVTYYNVFKFVQLSGEFEQLRINRKYEFDGANIEDNYWSPALFLGIGYTDRNITIGIRYDVLYNNDKSIYSDAWMPFIRVYF